jgi:hypothetical protein
MATIDQLEEKNEMKKLELSIAEKQALIAEAKKRYGSDWRRFLPTTGGGSQMDWNALRFRL